MGARLRYSRDELMASHAFARPNMAAGYSLHGGFDADGTYVSPRVLHRWPAVRAWGEALVARGWPLIDATTDLLKYDNYPTAAQERLLLQAGLGRTFWNSLTVTGIIEARGRMLAEFTPPSFEGVILDDIADTATGHLAKGLFAAHGMDEGGGDPRTPGEGAHDAMWFAVRDTVFGANAYPMVAPPESIARPVAVEREMPQLPPAHEALIKMMMNVLMIEVRAESFFAFCCAVFRDPTLFLDRRETAEAAAVLVERIREDEAIHVAYLQVAISEMRSFTFKGVDGRDWPGAEIIDPVWADMVDWHGRRTRELGRERTREEIRLQVVEAMGAASGAEFMARFDALDDAAGELAA